MSNDTTGDAPEAAGPTASPFNVPVIEEFRANGGRVGGMFDGAPLLLLTHTGAKSGRLRVNPLRYMSDGDRVVVFATNAGAADDPLWYRNVLANPKVTVEVGADAFPATAIPARGAERDRLWARIEAEDPAFAEYRRSTERTIPVVLLERAG
ncbi:nitroreductase family deazaflavin-dependent oxidoreductase [Nocardiopsis mangrovi]|uniref:Nitroreductase family deazaflavin-dependent oxidoreductase n=1 Tax=Nocardiopsis mangrovi TaxID=1179818 RepID=A0ABV9DXG4_9ACTN